MRYALIRCVVGFGCVEPSLSTMTDDDAAGRFQSSKENSSSSAKVDRSAKTCEATDGKRTTVSGDSREGSFASRGADVGGAASCT